MPPRPPLKLPMLNGKATVFTTEKDFLWYIITPIVKCIRVDVMYVYVAKTVRIV